MYSVTDYVMLTFIYSFLYILKKKENHTKQVLIPTTIKRGHLHKFANFCGRVT